MKEYQVMGVPPGRRKSEWICSYTLARWQWAEKFAVYISKKKGFTQVEIKEVEVDEDEVG